ncbi:hypothetical protein GK047_25230 [Paenibacillus sp. SYP-B3998]|uniref:Uncharacterized protein n=1 Tax=Paenibacillus sp. SYP-B3998 TaxID=2678564 RepID=A0A6G4A636_9BACL|nr:hypothetical protein [Paenibacillus sp. SYP-B3998]NEW09269.1 hypothetical protein [Paenibacillus sp. SYP-B3998]
MSVQGYEHAWDHYTDELAGSQNKRIFGFFQNRSLTECSFYPILTVQGVLGMIKDKISL